MKKAKLNNNKMAFAASSWHWVTHTNSPPQTHTCHLPKAHIL